MPDGLFILRRVCENSWVPKSIRRRSDSTHIGVDRHYERNRPNALDGNMPRKSPEPSWPSREREHGRKRWRLHITSACCIGARIDRRCRSARETKCEDAYMRLLSLILVSGYLCACSTLPYSFTTKNIMKIHRGMSSKEVLTMFGTPKSVSQEICGAATGRPWACTTWEYGKFPYDRASFTFSGDSADSLVLNDFNVQRD